MLSTRSIGWMLAVSVLASGARASTLYVEDLPSNGTGTSSNPFNDIQSALDAVQPGDTIYIRAGIYTGSWTSVRSGTATNKISIDGESKAVTILEGDGTPTALGLLIKHSHYNISRISFQNHYGHGLRIIGDPDDANVSTYIKSVYVSDCNFYQNGSGEGWAHGLYLKNVDDAFVGDVACTFNYTTGCTLANCKNSRVVDSDFSDNTGDSTSEGLSFLNCRDSSIEGCVAYNNSETGIDLSIFEGIPADLRDCVIEFCDVRENGGEGIAISGCSSEGKEPWELLFATDIDVIRSFVGHNADSGFVVYQEATNVDFIGCTSVHNNNRGISNYGDAASIGVRNCVFYKNRASSNGPFEDAGGEESAYIADYNYWFSLPTWMGDVVGTNDTTTSSPGFVDPLNGDFELLSTSPFIDQGDFDPLLDYDGSAPDLGAYEKQ